MRVINIRKVAIFLTVVGVCFTALHLSSMLSMAGERGGQAHAHGLDRDAATSAAPEASRDNLRRDDSLDRGTNLNSVTARTTVPSALASGGGEAASSRRDGGPARLALFSLERSGTAWLISMLNANRGVKIISEPMLSLSGKRAAASKELDALKTAMRSLEAEAQSAGPPLRLVGFGEKLFPGRYSLASDAGALQLLRQYLVDNEFKVVLLLRKNLVFQAVSMLRAARLSADARCGERAWSRTRGEAWEQACGAAARRVWAEPVDVALLRGVLDELRGKAKAVLTILSSFKMPRLTVYYEDMLKAPNRTLRLVSYWSGIRASDMLQSLPASTLREDAGEEFALASSNSTNIVNYQDIRKFLAKYNPCMLRTMEADASGDTDLTLCLV